jgi:hypothetical protein
MRSSQSVIDDAGEYKTGWFSHKCDCGWEGRVSESQDHCHECGQVFEEKNTLEFGGLLVEYIPSKIRFLVSDRGPSNSVILFERDIPDTLRFMARKFRPWEGGLPSIEEIRGNLIGSLRSIEAGEYEGAISRVKTLLEALGTDLEPVELTPALDAEIHSLFGEKESHQPKALETKEEEPTKYEAQPISEGPSEQTATLSDAPPRPRSKGARHLGRSSRMVMNPVYGFRSLQQSSGAWGG